MVEIERLRLAVRAAAHPERGEGLARRLRDAAVAGIERRGLHVGTFTPDEIVFIDRLPVQCTVSSAWDDEAIGAAITASVCAALEQSRDLPGTRVFRDRGELLAAYYVALAEGRAGTRWWLDEFEGLRALSASAALRSSVIVEGAAGLAALARLTPSTCGGVIRVLAAGDAARILEAWEALPGLDEVPVLAAWRESLLLATSTDGAAWVEALVGIERTAAGSVGREALATLRSMCRLRQAAARGGLRQWAADRAGDSFESESGVEAALRELARTGLPVAWAAHLTSAAAIEVLRELVKLASTRVDASGRPDEGKVAAANPAGNEATVLRTPRGGILVLLRVLEWLAWPAAWRQALAREGCDDPDRVAREMALAVAAHALAPRQAAASRRDPALRLALALEAPQSLPPAARCVLGTPRSVAAARLLEAFAERVPGLRGSSAMYLRRNALGFAASVERHAQGCRVRLGPAPLDVLLRLAGCRRGSLNLPGGVRVNLEEVRE